MKYNFIKTELKSYPVCLCCKVLSESRTGYYHWQKRRATQRILEEKRILEMIRKHFNLSRGRYGLLRIYRAIRKEGSQYTSSKVKSLLDWYKFKQSMSDNGNCYDNAITETFFSTLKKELVYLTKFETREQARREIFEYIEIFHNRHRLHSSLDYLSPVEYRIKMSEEFKSKVA